MLKSLLLASALLIVPAFGKLSSTTCNAQSTASTVPNFVFEGTSFNTTATEFKKQWQHDAIKIGSYTDLKIGIEQFYTVAIAARKVETRFYKDHLYQMSIYYNNTDMNRIGEFDILRNRLVQKYGEDKPNNVVGKLEWKLENMIIWLDGPYTLNEPPNLLILTVINQSLNNEATIAQKAGSNTGF